MAVGATVDVRNARVELGNARDHDDDDHGCGSDGATGRLSRPVRHRLRDLDEREGDLESLAVAVSPTTVTTAAKRTLGPFPALGELTVDVSGNLYSASGSTTIKYAPPSVATFTNVKLTTIKAIELPTGFTVASIAIDETGVIYAAGSLVGINEIVASSASGAFPAAQVPIAVLPNAASQISI